MPAIWLSIKKRPRGSTHKSCKVLLVIKHFLKSWRESLISKVKEIQDSRSLIFTVTIKDECAGGVETIKQVKSDIRKRKKNAGQFPTKNVVSKCKNYKLNWR